jgi:hypothetical protein
VLPNGDVEVGVHIADVTYFVPHKSALDTEAQVKATTFYLVDRRFDMLPSLLSSGAYVPYTQSDHVFSVRCFSHYLSLILGMSCHRPKIYARCMGAPIASPCQQYGPCQVISVKSNPFGMVEQ